MQMNTQAFFSMKLFWVIFTIRLYEHQFYLIFYYYYFILAYMTVRSRGRANESIHVYKNLIILQHFANSAVYFCLTNFFLGNWREKKQQNFCILNTRALLSLPLYHNSALLSLFSSEKRNSMWKAKAFNFSFWDSSISDSLKREWRNSFCYQFSSHLHLYQSPFLGNIIV